MSFNEVTIKYSTSETEINNGEGTILGSFGGNTTILTNLSANTKYYLRFTSKNKKDISGTYLDTSMTILGDITEFTAEATDYDSVLLSWDGHYENVDISYSDGVLTGKTGTSYSITGLTANKDYYFQIKPYNTVGNAATTYYDGFLPSTQTYGNITAFSAAATDSSSITLSWTGNFGTVDISYSGGILTSKTGTSYSVTGLDANTDYYFQIKPYNTVGTGSSYYSVVPMAETYGNITAFTAMATDMSSITLSWTGNFETVDISYSEGVLTGKTGTSYSITGLTANKDYYFQIKPYNSVGNAATTYYDGFLPSTQTYGNITAFSAAATDSSSITLSWTGNFGTVDISYSGGVLTGKTGTSYSVTGLDANTDYYFQIKPYNTAGTGSSYYSVVPMAETYGNIITFDIGASSTIDTSSVGLVWTGNFASVDISGAVYESGSYTINSAGLTGTSTTITGLSSYKKYSFLIRPVNTAGITGSSVAAARNVCTAGYINGLASSSVDSSAVVLNCSGGFDYVEVRYSDDSNFTTYTDVSNVYTATNLYTVSGLTSSTTYYFKARPVTNTYLTGISYYFGNYYGTSISSTTLSGYTFNMSNANITTSSTNYNVYIFTSSTTVSYTVSSSVTIGCFCVGGGGAGGYWAGGGGGAGGIVQSTTTIPSSSSGTITITIGSGGIGFSSLSAINKEGSDSLITFSGNTSLNITAKGGGYGGSWLGDHLAGSGGSSGGSRTTTNVSQSAAAITYNNLGNRGGLENQLDTTVEAALRFFSGGGGGAGCSGGYDASYNTTYGKGGDGIQCTLFNEFSTVATYGTKYWGGGGGGSSLNGNPTTGGQPGKGGGGGGACLLNTNYYASDTNGINSGTAPNAGTNTGGGGGGSFDNTSSKGGNGGSGIVIMMIPK